MSTYKIEYTDPEDDGEDCEHYLECTDWEEASSYGYDLADKGCYSIYLKAPHPKFKGRFIWIYIDCERLEKLKKRDYSKYKREGGLEL